MKIVLIPSAGSEWCQQGRLLGRVELPPRADRESICAGWVERLRQQGVSRILHSSDELATWTARFLAQRLGVTARAADELAEVDLGLWAGLTEEQLATRYESAHRQLLEAPLTVSPPQGESLRDASARLESCIRKRIKRNGSATLAFVLRPIAFELARAALERDEVSLWQHGAATEPLVIDLDRQAVLSDPQST